MATPAVCSALYILDGNFKTLLSRDWRGDTSPAHVERFAARVNEAESESAVTALRIADDACCSIACDEDVLARSASCAFVTAMSKSCLDTWGERETREGDDGREGDDRGRV